jgi:hypothetical protein
MPDERPVNIEANQIVFFVIRHDFATLFKTEEARTQEPPPLPDYGVSTLLVFQPIILPQSIV